MNKDALLGGGVLGILLDGVFNSFNLIFGSLDLLMGSVDILYPIILVLNRLSINFGWLDQDLITNLVLVISVLYLIHLSLRLKRRVQNET